jgi:hypothetical protein
MTPIATWFSTAGGRSIRPIRAIGWAAVIDSSAGRPFCEVALQHPPPCVGKWIIKVLVCDMLAMVSAAGRPDDPHTVRLTYKPNYKG